MSLEGTIVPGMLRTELCPGELNTTIKTSIFKRVFLDGCDSMIAERFDEIMNSYQEVSWREQHFFRLFGARPNHYANNGYG